MEELVKDLGIYFLWLASIYLVVADARHNHKHKIHQNFEVLS